MVIVKERQFEVVTEPDADGFKALYWELVGDRVGSNPQELHVGGDEDAVFSTAVQMLVTGVEAGEI